MLLAALAAMLPVTNQDINIKKMADKRRKKLDIANLLLANLQPLVWLECAERRKLPFFLRASPPEL
jgi:hypothetical protein